MKMIFSPFYFPLEFITVTDPIMHIITYIFFFLWLGIFSILVYLQYKKN